MAHTSVLLPCVASVRRRLISHAAKGCFDVRMRKPYFFEKCVVTQARHSYLLNERNYAEQKVAIQFGTTTLPLCDMNGGAADALQI